MSRFKVGDRVVHDLKSLGSGTLYLPTLATYNTWLVDTDRGTHEYWSEPCLTLEVPIEALAKTFEGVPDEL